MIPWGHNISTWTVRIDMQCTGVEPSVFASCRRLDMLEDGHVMIAGADLRVYARRLAMLLLVLLPSHGTTQRR